MDNQYIINPVSLHAILNFSVSEEEKNSFCSVSFLCVLFLFRFALYRYPGIKYKYENYRIEVRWYRAGVIPCDILVPHIDSKVKIIDNERMGASPCHADTP